MHNFLSKKAQFFILTSVVIIGAFYTLSKYINPYTFIDASKAFRGDEVFFFNNMKEKAEKVVELSDPTDLRANLQIYESFVKEVAGEKGYSPVLNYIIYSEKVDFTMVLQSQRMTLKSDFSVPR